MKSILERIFLANEFQWERYMTTEPDWPETYFAMRPEEHLKKEYFVVQFLDNLDVILGGNGPIMYYRKILKALENHEGHNAHFAKNTNLLIAVKVPNYDFERIESTDDLLLKFFEIEENPYFFKKHVIPYTESQAADFHTKWPFSNLDTSPQEWIAKLQDFAKTSSEPNSWFNEFKEDVKHHRATEIRLLAQLFIKIPFFQLIVKSANLKNLKDQINRKLGPGLTRLRNASMDELSDEDANERWIQEALQLIQNINTQDNG